MKKMIYTLFVIALVASSSAFAAKVTTVALSYEDNTTVARIDVEGAIRFAHQTEVPKDGKGHRMILDVLTATHALSAKTFDNLPDCPVTAIRTSQFSVQPEKVVRVVFDVTKAPLYRVEQKGNSIYVYFTDKSVKPFASWSSSNVSPAPAKETRTPAPATASVTPKPAATVAVTPTSTEAQRKSAENDRMASLGSTPAPTTPAKPSTPATPAVTPKPAATATATPVQTAPKPAAPVTVAQKPEPKPMVPATPKAEPKPMVPATIVSTTPAKPSETKPSVTPTPAPSKPTTPTVAKSEPVKPAPATSTAKPVEKPTTVATAPVTPKPYTPAPLTASAKPAEKPAVAQQPTPAAPKQDVKPAVPPTPVVASKPTATPTTPAKPTTKPSEAKVTIPSPDFSSDTIAEEDLMVAVDPNAPADEEEDLDDAGIPYRPNDTSSTARFRRNPAQAAKFKGTMIAEFPKRLLIKYEQKGRRDPFATLIDDSRSTSGPTEKSIPNIDGLRLVGVIEAAGPGGNRGLFEDKDGFSYILESGDKVQKGYVLRIEDNTVYFQIFEYGWTRTVALKMEEI